MNELTTKPQFDLTPQTLDDALRFAEVLANSTIIPKDFQGNPGNILVAIQWGMELGLKPMQAMQSIAVINGRPSLWGDAVIGLVRGSAVCEYIKETDDGHTATIRVKRRGENEEHVRTFSVDDAKAAGLAGKQGPWTSYPKRMRQMRARAFALRDVFPDVLRGMAIAEEEEDKPTPTEKYMGEAQTAEKPSTQQEALQALPFYPDDVFSEQLATWQGYIEAGRATPERIIDTVESKYQLSDEQKEKIKKLQNDEVTA